MLRKTGFESGEVATTTPPTSTHEVTLTPQSATPTPTPTPAVVPVDDGHPCLSSSIPFQASTAARPAASSNPVLFHATDEATVTLEFLALGRQNILNRNAEPSGVTHQDPPNLQPNEEIADDAIPSWSHLMSPNQARQLLEYHQTHVAWMHNIIHGPSFRADFEANLRRNTVDDKSWLALYYAIVCVSATQPG